MPSPNQLRYRIIIKNKKLRSSNEFSGNMGKAILQRTTTMDEPADNDEEYDSDFGEDEFEDEQGTLNVAEIDLNMQGGWLICAFIFKMFFHFQDVFSFSKCALNEHCNFLYQEQITVIIT